MPSFRTVANGDTGVAADVDQIVNALNGTAGQGVPIALTAPNDAVNWALAVRNNEAGASKVAIFYKADGTVLLQVDKNGVVASPDGAAAAAQLVTTTFAQTLTGKTIDSANNTIITRNAALGADVARANHSVNGLLNVWQRTVQAYTATGGTAGPDRLFIALAGTDTISCTQDTANRDSSGGAKYSLACAFVLGTGAGGSSVYEQFKTTTDLYGFLRGHTITRSWRVKTNVAAAVRVSMTGDGTGGISAFSAYHTGDGTWQTLTVTYAVPTDATFVNCLIYFAASGTHYVGAHATVIGTVAVDPYVVALPPADDLARCLRYYETFGAPAGSDMIVRNSNILAAGVADLAVPFRAIKAASPTVTKVGTWTVSPAGMGQPAAVGVSTMGFIFRITNGATPGDGYAINTPAGTYITVEANP